ncbi:hypothetical protein [Lacipirellula limnantheis]|uniref:hypothetical protein n=1 Tax=Lacipirellula limnantheis TaxID=2528024 RepID=UPI001AEFF8F1|nr:hypothetical protein [Lacipirellula limnantheis]
MRISGGEAAQGESRTPIQENIAPPQTDLDSKGDLCIASAIEFLREIYHSRKFRGDAKTDLT